MKQFYMPLPVVAASLKPFYRVALWSRLPFGVQRKFLDGAASLQVNPEGTVVQTLSLSGRITERITVGATERKTAVLYLHGGAFTIGSLKTHRSLAAHLAQQSSTAVYSLDYRLAPENPYPAGLDDAVAAYRELMTVHGFTADQIAIAGDSAGGGLAVAAARRLVDDGIHPAALALMSPWVNPGARDAPFYRDLLVNTGWSYASADAYLGSGDPTDQGFAPLLGDLTGLPPTVVHVGTSEVLYLQVLEFVDKLRASGNDVQLREYEKLWHVAHLQASLLREAAEAVADLGAFLAAHLAPAASHPMVVTPVGSHVG